MAQATYHHGNLRTALLEQAQLAVREHGVEQLSLRELARQVGVSHGAPRRHFSDRQALLDALAEAGFERLGAELARAVARAGDDFQARLTAIATAYVRFAPDRIGLLLFATLQGIAALVGSGMLDAALQDELVADAVARFLRGPRG
jgi:AcrR family transcriptional regulator